MLHLITCHGRIMPHLAELLFLRKTTTNKQKIKMIFAAVVIIYTYCFNPFSPVDENRNFGNSVDPDEMTHYEPSHLGLQCLPFCV